MRCQAALLSWLLLGEEMAPVAWFGTGVGTCGVPTLSLAGRDLHMGTLFRATVQPAALCGLGAGAGFAVAGVGIKAATMALAVSDTILGALFALVVISVLQTLMQGGYMAWREPAGLRAAFSSWRSSAWVGALSAGGSACWFASFALAPVAFVRTLGQVEMVFTLRFSRFYSERVVAPRRHRWAAAGHVRGGIGSESPLTRQLAVSIPDATRRSGRLCWHRDRGGR